jgi:hypothetical protein
VAPKFEETYLLNKFEEFGADDAKVCSMEL